MADQVDPTLPQSSFPYPVGEAKLGTPTGSEQLITKAGKISHRSGRLFINSTTVGITLTLEAPTEDNLELEIVNLDGSEHVIKTDDNVINGTSDTITFDQDDASPPVANALRLVSREGVWWALYPNGVSIS